MPELLILQRVQDSRGSLTVLDNIEKVLPFPIKRLYYIQQADCERGGHCHQRTHQAVICMVGRCVMTVKNRVNDHHYLLDSPDKCVLLQPDDWHSVAEFSPDAILLFLASTVYDPADYITVPYESLKLVNRVFEEDFKRQLERVLARGWYISGERLKQFEDDFAAYHQIKHCIGVGSGLDALVMSLRALKLEEKSEVIVPSNTYIATILAIIHSGLTPVLVEPDIKSYTIDPEKIIENITPRTRAVFVVHLYGKCCDMDRIREICNEHELFLLEDCAQSHGAKYKGQVCGTFGALAGFSFYPTKNLGCLGDGGGVLTNSDEYAEHIRLLGNYGTPYRNDHQIIGYNSRLDELQAAFLEIKLKALDDITAHKRKLAAIYLEHLREDFIKPVVDNDHDDVYHLFTIRHSRRDELREYLKSKGVGTEIHYPVPPHKQKALCHLFENKSFPIAEEIHRTTLSLPCSTAHTENDIYKVIDVINAFNCCDENKKPRRSGGKYL